MKKVSYCQSEIKDSFEYYYSKARFSSYPDLNAYNYDIQLSEAFYPALRTLEIILRNGLWNAIANTFNNNNWLLDNTLLCDQEQKILQETQLRIQRYYPKRTHENDHLISELNFGFWTNLLNHRYEQILWPICLKHFAVYLPRKHRHRQFLHNRLREIRDLRNRIFHHQRISHMKDIDRRHQEIVELIAWIEPKIYQDFQRIDRFSIVYQKN